MSKAESKFRTAVKIVRALQPVYLEEDAAGRDLIEMTVAAKIFYLPANKALQFSGMISEAAAASTDKLCQEHMYPRKISARKLLNTDLSNIADPVKFMRDLYYTELGRYNLVTREENTRLRPFQKADVFTTPEAAYAAAGVRLIAAA